MKENLINWGGNGPILHLAHANSYHPATYELLIEELKPHFEVQSILFRPFQKDKNVADFDNWNLLRDDFLEIAYKHNWTNIVGLGHSLGSTVSMMAAIKQPEIFSKLVIIEPPCIDQIFFTALNLIPYSIAKHLVPPSKQALKRRHKWENKKEAFEFFRPKSIFRDVNDITLKAYIDSGIELSEDGFYRLVYSKFWESKIYCTIKNPYELFPKLKVPSLCIRAEESNVINEKNWLKWQKIHKNAIFFNIPKTGHLVPFEDPKSIAESVIKFASH